jgi:hypothetical protein
MLTIPKVHHQIRSFFSEPCAVRAVLELLGEAFLGLDGPMLHGLIAQLAEFFDEEFLDLVGRERRGMLRLAQGRDGFDALEELRVIAQRGEQTFFTRGIDRRTMVGIHGFDKVSMKEKKYSYGIYNLPPIPTSPPISGWHQFQSHPS